MRHIVNYIQYKSYGVMEKKTFQGRGSQRVIGI